MSELKFLCPRCNQKIQCDEQWGGHKIQCPSCQVELVVPRAQTASAPAPSPIPPPPAPARPAPMSPPPRGMSPALASQGGSPLASRRAKARAKAKMVKILLGVIVGGLACYFGFGLMMSWQNKLNEAGEKAEKNSDGGQLGHIAELHAVLDATDPNRGEMVDLRELTTARSRETREARRAERAAEEKELPVIPAVWTLEPDLAKIPEGRVNGMISGTNFVLDAARLERTGQSYVLSLRQGTGVNADSEILVFLRLNAGETLFGYSQTISKEMKGARVPQIVKRWKPNPKYAPQQKSYNTGYVMKLELGKMEDDTVPGKIYIALPDTEQTVAAGLFKIRAAWDRVEIGMGSVDDSF
jgi:hypothetical protein